ncbi:DUF6879 family protein [Streptoalloteichus hindustanus]|uniref:DUF6879 family protein n=1 Tax=Streptoalloteichus hindustanus TaxID=2017 RepID=UPI003899DF84
MMCRKFSRSGGCTTSQEKPRRASRSRQIRLFRRHSIGSCSPNRISRGEHNGETGQSPASRNCGDRQAKPSNVASLTTLRGARSPLNGAELLTDPATVAPYRSWRDTAWRHAVAFNDYMQP